MRKRPNFSKYCFVNFGLPNLRSAEEASSFAELLKKRQKAEQEEAAPPETKKPRKRERKKIAETEIKRTDASASNPSPSVTRAHEESKIKFSMSGFAWTEFEQTKHFGYDVGDTAKGQVAQPNFNANVAQPKQTGLNFFSNITFQAEKDNSSLVGIFEVGEVKYGDSNSGGAIGARAGNIFEVRNLYIDHKFDERFGLSAGLINVASDPRSFIFNDHVGSIVGAYKTELSEGQVWYADATKNLPAAATKSRDIYQGFNGTLGFIKKATVTTFVVHREQSDTTRAVPIGGGAFNAETGNTNTFWFGGTIDYPISERLNLQLTGIRSQAKTKLHSAEKTNIDEDSVSGHLFDANLSFDIVPDKWKLSLEGLATSGSNDTVDSASGNTIINRRKNFDSPVGVSYLLTVATSDGADDAPGAAKQSSFANLGQVDGLRLLIGTLSANLTKKITAFVRYGIVESIADNTTTFSNKMGKELDLGMVYQLTPSASLQADYGRFAPGSYYSFKDSAELAAIKFKFAFE